MTATTTVRTRSVASRTSGATRPSLVRAGLIAAVLASAATETFTAVLRASGVHLAAGNIGGSAADVTDIGPGACSIMIVLCVTLGLAVAGVVRRRAQRPRRTWIVTSCALTVVSFVPDVLAGHTAASSKISLMVAHVIAAVIVIPLVARSLRTAR